MTHHPFSSLRRVRFAFILVFSSAAAIAGLQAARLPDGSRLTSVANVTLRQTPAPGAPAVGQLPLGSELTDVGPPGMDKTWIRVRAADGREGWVQSSMTKRVDPVWRWSAYDEIVAERLARKGDGFPAAVELVAFIDRVAPEYTNTDGRAHIELARLRAVSATLSAIPAKADRREPYAGWVKSLGPLVIFDEPGKRWILSDKAIWDLHGKSAKTPSADAIAWLAVTNGLNGECEGYLPCYVDWRNRLEGEYLRRQPDGAHVGDAVSSISRTVGQLAAPARPHEAFQFDRGRDCRDLTASLEALTKAVQVTRSAEKENALSSLGSLKRLCQ